MLINWCPCNNCEICDGCQNTRPAVSARYLLVFLYPHKKYTYFSFIFHKKQLKITTLIFEAPCRTSGILFVGKSHIYIIIMIMIISCNNDPSSALASLLSSSHAATLQWIPSYYNVPTLRQWMALRKSKLERSAIVLATLR